MTKPLTGQTSTLKRINVALVKNALRVRGTATRRELSEVTNLSQPTVNAIINMLREENEVVYRGSALSSGGRRAELYALNHEHQLVAAVFAMADHLEFAVTDTSGAILSHGVSPISPDREYVEQIRKLEMAHEEVVGIHDLVVHDYGPGRCMISLHAEVPADRNLMELHDEIDNAERELSRQLNCTAVIHMDPLEVNDQLTTRTREAVIDLVHGIDPAISIHDFRMVTGPTHTNLIFDAMVPHQFRLSDAEVSAAVREAVSNMEGHYFAVVTVERSYV